MGVCGVLGQVGRTFRRALRPINVACRPAPASVIRPCVLSFCQRPPAESDEQRKNFRAALHGIYDIVPSKETGSTTHTPSTWHLHEEGKRLLIAARKRNQPPSALMLLGPSQIHQYCSAYLVGKPIGGVPLDPREGGTTVLGEHLEACEFQSPKRHPLLCNH